MTLILRNLQTHIQLFFDRINPAMRGAGMDLHDSFYCLCVACRQASNCSLNLTLDPDLVKWAGELLNRTFNMIGAPVCIFTARPKTVIFSPTNSRTSGSNYNPRNTQCVDACPAVFKRGGYNFRLPPLKVRDLRLDFGKNFSFSFRH